MAQLYLRAGLHERPVRFEHFFRSYPDYGDHQAGYCVAAGLGAVRRVGRRRVRARPADVDALRGHRVARRRAGCSTTRSATGSAASTSAGCASTPCPRAASSTRTRRSPSSRARWPPPSCSRRRCSTSSTSPRSSPPRRPGSSRPSHGRPVLEFGMRRAAADGADAASRAAIVGGAVVDVEQRRRPTSSGCTPAGTHAHSMVQLFIALGERRAGRVRRLRRRLPRRHACCSSTPSTRWAAASPTPSPRSSACAGPGHEPVGIRLDSGDLAYLAVQAARELDRGRVPRHRRSCCRASSTS